MRASTLNQVVLLAFLAVAIWLGRAGANEPPRKHDTGNPPVPRAPWDTDDDYAVRQRLDRELPAVKFDAVPFDEVLTQLSKMSDATITANWAVLDAEAIDRTAEVTLNVYHLRVSKVLDLIVDCGGGAELWWDVIDDAVIVSTKEDWMRRTFTVVYDCSDLVTVPPAALAKYVSVVFDETLRLTKRDLSHDEEQIERLVRHVIRDSRKGLQQTISRTIVKCVDRLSWDEEGGNVGTMEWAGTRLVIVQTRQAHREVFELLTALRRQPVGPAPIGQWP